MTEAEKIRLEEKMKKLPKEVQGEVYDFIEFLEQKHQETPASATEKQGEQDSYKKGKEILLELGEGLGEGPKDLAENHNRYLN